MQDEGKTRKQLMKDLEELRQQVFELELLKKERKNVDDSLQKAHDKLERRVKKRTAELPKVNERLKYGIEERRQAELELKRTKEYLENVIDNSVDAIGIVDKHGEFILWNRRAAEIYGYKFDELAGKTAFDLYADSEQLDRMLARLRRDEVVREYEILMKKKDGNIVPMDISISLLKDDYGDTSGSVCVARDLSERKKAEIALKLAKEQLSRYSKDLERQVRERTREITSILRNTPAVVYIKNKDGCYRLVNARYEKLFGISDEEIRGKSDYDIFPKEIADQFRATDLQVFREKRPCQVEERIPQADGTHIYLSVKFPLYDGHGLANGICGISTDITELKSAQDQLRRLSGSIMAGQEKERASIARELHDELGQVLTALRMDAVWLRERLNRKDAKAAERASTMCDLIDATIDEVRGMALRLRPKILDDLGLIDALEWHTTDFEKRTGIVCIFRHDGVTRISDLVATAAYRIAQEALTNVARHSRATHADVTLRVEVEGGMLTLTVVDTGCGFETHKIADGECLGMAGMRERASLVGGNLEVRSQSGKGTCVCFRLPIDSNIGAAP
ncbi:MAG: PAS domain S-box protein [Desulfobacterales bacterium]|uniref:histidine kinase n=1 Tax=Candidatus Desulfatibia profunda TaxID=2841695 RepID=A0A8J6NQU6_9BACT|nr:PAS domain S-box protein [Candidatus Desulfatibia profunda]MBL7179754.1 PAS domain S-box protein [Desulfobacterales bacterium]